MIFVLSVLSSVVVSTTQKLRVLATSRANVKVHLKLFQISLSVNINLRLYYRKELDLSL